MVVAKKKLLSYKISKTMNVNTLVKHKTKNLGIGCISKVLSKSVKVNFGTDDCITVKTEMLTLVDVSKSKTIPFDVLRKQSFLNTVKDSPVIIGNELKHYVGIGWISKGVITESDLLTYKRAI